MSLVGSLADLSLGDVLQIISLSQKSGVLQLRSPGGEGRLVFRNGLVRAAVVSGEAQDLRTLLVEGGFTTKAIFDQAEAEARSGSATLEDALARLADLSPEKLDSLRRESVEAAVVSMFRWQSGEFSFDVGVEPEDSSQLSLETGINAQFLAMEAARLGDEDERSDPVESSVDSPHPENPAASEASGETEETAKPTQSDAAAEQAPVEEAREQKADSQPPVVVIEPDLAALEWIKAALGERFPRVHIFQRTELGLNRIRQYLGRAEIPLLLLSCDAPPDPSTRSSAADLARRLKRRVPKMTILWLAEVGREVEGVNAEGIAYRARSSQIGDPQAAGALNEAAAGLREALARSARGARS